MKLFLLSFFLLLAACKPGSQERTAAPGSDSLIHSVSDIQSYLLHQIDLLDSAREADDYDALDSINNNIYRGLEKLAKNDAYQTITFSQDDPISYLLSEDKKLCVVSWDTRTGGTLEIDANVVIYQTSAGTKSQYFGDDPNTDESERFLGYFTELYGLTNADSVTTYFAYGQSKGSTILYSRVLQAFRISADTLDHTRPAFDDRENKIEYDLSKFGYPDDIKEITFSTDHREIQVPEVEDETPTGRYHKYNFSNGIYRRVK
jgi:hypothetical protein